MDFLFLSFSFFFFLGLHLQPKEVPRLGVELELQPLGDVAATAMQDSSHICDLHHSSQQWWILNPLSKARDQTYDLIVPSRIRFHYATMGTPKMTSVNKDVEKLERLCTISWNTK
mgnify:CR=1 FL=1